MVYNAAKVAELHTFCREKNAAMRDAQTPLSQYEKGYAGALQMVATRLKEAQEEEQPRPVETCEWKQDGPQSDYFDTSCARDTFRRPVGAKFCCFCGKPLIEVPFNG
jgi:hypothetical protein